MGQSHGRGRKMRDLCCVLKFCCIPGVGRDGDCPYHRGQIHFQLGSLPKGRTAAPAALRRNLGVSLAQGGWALTKPAPDAPTQRAGQGKEHGEQLSPPKREQEVPQGVCSALRELGESPGGEVNIVRRGGASPAGLLPPGGGPASSAPAGCWGHLQKPRSRARSWAGLRVCKPGCRLWLGEWAQPSLALLSPHPRGDQHREQPLLLPGAQNRDVSVFLPHTELS